MHILVTGAFGWTAQAILEALKAAEHDVTAFDLVTAEWGDYISEWTSHVILGSVADFDAVHSAMADSDVVIHLAVAVGEGDYDTPDVPFSTNVKGVYNIMEAARQHKVKRVILMSEAPVHIPNKKGDVWLAIDPLKTSSDNPQEHLYDLTKRLQEEIAHNYADTYSMNVVVLRPGHIVDSRTGLDPHERPLEELTYLRGGWVCRYDLAQAVMQALTRKLRGYHAFHVIGSERARRYFDIEYTEHALEFTIQARFEEYV